MNTKSFALALSSVVLVPALVACGAADPAAEEETSPTASRSDALWGCNVRGESVVCTAALTAPSPDAAYACAANDKSARCPSAIALSKTAGLEAMLERTGAKDRFVSITWACLVTGKVQHQCVRDLSAVERAHLNGGGTDGEGAPVEGGDSTKAPRPALPSSCEPEAWEPYFAKLATWAYQFNGVDVEFPEDIFDCHAGIGSIASGVIANEASNLASCAAGEAAMRAEAWIDAVACGCLNLNIPILAMCQQAADWAPANGACTATGSW